MCIVEFKRIPIFNGIDQKKQLVNTKVINYTDYSQLGNKSEYL